MDSGQRSTSANLTFALAKRVGELSRYIDGTGPVPFQAPNLDYEEAVEWLESLGFIERGAKTPGSTFLSRKSADLWPRYLGLLGHRVEAVVDVTPCTSPVSVVTAFERTPKGDRAPYNRQRAIFSGRGPSPLLAVKGAMLEAAETFSARWKKNSADEAELDDLANKNLNRGDLDHSTTSKGVSLVSGRTVSVPSHKVYLDFPAALSPGNQVAPGSNGLASGESYEQARDAAIFELIERDAVSIWWRSRHKAPPWHPITKLAAAAVYPVERWLNAKGRRLQFLNLTHDLSIPVVLAHSTAKNGAYPLIAAACDASQDQAAYAALSELIQMEVNIDFIKRNIDELGLDSLTKGAQQVWAWYSSANLLTHPHLLPKQDATNLAAPSPFDRNEAISSLKEALIKAEIEISIVDLTDDQIRIPVVRAFSKDLMNFHHMNERARSVPRALGLDSGIDGSRQLSDEPIPL